MNELENYINSYFGIPANEINKISSFFKETTTKKGEFFLREGAVCKQLSFQKSGLLRVYANAEKEEVTQWISTSGYFITDLSGIIFNQASKYSIQAISDSCFYTISKEDYDNIGKFIPQWQLLEKLFIAKCFTQLEARIYGLLSMTAEERYNQLFQLNPSIFNEAPLKYIASMMGMSPETLSRIRKKSLK